MPFAAASRSTSLSTTSQPASAHEYAMPAPIIPAPRTATLVGAHRSYPDGREAPPLIACMSKKNALVMFLATCPVASSTKYRVSMRSAVSTSTCAPSTAAARMLRGAGSGAPLSCLRRLAGNAGSTAASFGVDGVPPGMR